MKTKLHLEFHSSFYYIGNMWLFEGLEKITKKLILYTAKRKWGWPSEEGDSACEQSQRGYTEKD